MEKRKVINKGFVEDADFTSFRKIANRDNGGNYSNEFSFTLETAKHVAMMENTEKGKLVRKYFIVMEKTLRNYEKWTEVREPQKAGDNEMKYYINENYKEDYNVDVAPAREFIDEHDMLNIALLGMRAKQARDLLGCNDKITREHFTTEINKALSDLQAINTSLIISKVPLINAMKL